MVVFILVWWLILGVLAAIIYVNYLTDEALREIETSDTPEDVPTYSLNIKGVMLYALLGLFAFISVLITIPDKQFKLI